MRFTTTTAPLGDQAGRLRPLRRQRRLPHERRRAPDQDGAGREARRGRPAARPQGRPLHRERAADDAGRRPDLAAAASRHLLDRGPEAADLRPALRESRGARLGEARRGGRRRHGRRRRREGERRPRAHLRPRRRHRRLAALVDPVRRHPVGDRARGDAADARAQRPALADLGADRRPAQDRARRRRRRAARRRRDGLRDRAADRDGLRDDARLPPQHVPGRDRDAGSRAAASASPGSPSTSSTSCSSSPRRRAGSWRGSASAASRISSAASTCSRPTTRSRVEGARHRPLGAARTRPTVDGAAATADAGAGLAARRRARLAADRGGAHGARARRRPDEVEFAIATSTARSAGCSPTRHEGARRRRAPRGHDPRHAARLGRAVVRRLARARRRARRSSATRTTTSARASPAACSAFARRTAPASSPRRT